MHQNKPNDNPEVYEYVRDVPPDYDLITNSQDIKAITRSLPKCDMLAYGSLFVYVAEGDIVSVYGCWQCVPFLDRRTTHLFGTKTVKVGA